MASDEERTITRRTLIGTAAAAAGAAALPAEADARAAKHGAHPGQHRKHARTLRRAEVIVVGAGRSGLAAARAIEAAGRSAIVLEARDRVGGRTLNHHLGAGKVIEVGGQWIGPTQLGRRVMLSEPVWRIVQGRAGVTVHTDELTFHGKHAIVTGPPSLTVLIDYEPALPAMRAQLLQRFPQGSSIKIQAVYPKPFWRAQGLADQVTSDTGPIKLTWDNSPLDGSPGVLIGFVEGGRAPVRPALARRPPRPGDRLLRALLRSAGGEPNRLCRDELGRRALDPRLLRRVHAARRPDRLWPLDPGSLPPRPLGRGGDVGPLERLHGRSDPLRPARRARGTHRVTGRKQCSG